MRNASIEDFEEKEKEISIQVYPNPCASWLKITGSGEDNFQVTIMDLSGHRIPLLIQFDNSECLVDLSNTEDGCYLLQVVSDRWKEVKKIEVLKK
ncbi:MAG: T9SS type A sorting domain-containing protein [Chitinophagales bacterium]